MNLNVSVCVRLVASVTKCSTVNHYGARAVGPYAGLGGGGGLFREMLAVDMGIGDLTLS